MEEAKKLIGTGNKHLVMGDVVSAVTVFQDACSMLAAKYGETADECGEAFFLCGKSLLELARMENSVLGNALEGVPEESEEDQPNDSKIESANNLDEETRDELRIQVYDAMAEKEKAGEVKDMSRSEEPMNGKEESSVQEVNVNGVEKSPVGDSPTGSPGKESVKEVDSKEKPEEGKGESKTEPEEEEEDEGPEGSEEEEVGNLQLAWEMLEVAKVIYKRKENTDYQLMAAQTFLKLGEVSAESGNYPQALEDFQECLSLQLKHLPPHNRLLAETHYHVATTLCYMDQYSQAIQHYNSSIKVIETRLAMLQEVMATAEEEAAAEDNSEMEELKQLLPDIRERIEDAKESQKTASTASQAIQQTLVSLQTVESPLPRPFVLVCVFVFLFFLFFFCFFFFTQRKPEEESPVKDTDAKQAKQEATVNGSSDSSASNGNGVEEGKSQEASDGLLTY
uniref:Tetratricopeptide SHNi-TPR domain-containing protein n=1 Tax=Mola mola TaxID=94237 RepID=A0A3Q3VM99_MOLML